MPRPPAVRTENLAEELFDPADTSPVFTELTPSGRELLKIMALTAAELQPMPLGSDFHERFNQYDLPGTLRAPDDLATEAEDASTPDPWKRLRNH
ncbi:hypothetical protein [Streptomyces sp. NPDC057939]|uniref:hypothetical protein n=1 Tax=Streptomyces sp. NPDC057939 TaxID=3346284 RepID=UPI0036E9B79C